MNRKICLALFVMAILLFLLPWITVSCSGTQVASFTGLDMVTGKSYGPSSGYAGYGSVGNQRAGSEPLAIIALALGAAGVGAALFWKKAAMARVVLGVVGAVLLVALKIKLDGDVSKQGQGVVQISYEFWYWLTIFVFVAAAAINFLKREIAFKLGTGAEASSSGGGAGGESGGKPPG